MIVKEQCLVELFGPLVGLNKEWAQQGATEDELEMVAFDWDYVPGISCGAHTGQRGGFKTEVIEETKDYIIKKRSSGKNN